MIAIPWLLLFGETMMETKIVVYYTCVNRWNIPCFEELLFDTEEEADRFIDRIKNRMDVNRIIKAIDWKFEGRNKNDDS